MNRKAEELERIKEELRGLDTLGDNWKEGWLLHKLIRILLRL